MLAGVAVAIALALLVESFGRDVIWLALRRRSTARSRAGDDARPAEVDAP
jgi:hypothetical protein